MKKVLLIGLGFLAAVALSLQAEQLTTTTKEGFPREYEKRSPSIREVERNEVAVPFPAKLVEDFLSSNQIRSDSEINAAPSVLGLGAGRLYGGAGDEFYVHGLPRETLKRYGVFRQGDSYIDPDSGEILGHHIIKIGVARVVGVEGNLATLVAVRAKTAIRRGDRLFKEINHMSANEMYLEPTSELIDGSIIALADGRNTAGAMDIVALNRGYEEGLEPGKLLDLFTKGERLKTLAADSVIDAPDLRIGSILVFSVYKKVSHGIILQASQQVISGTKVKNP